MKKSNLIFAIVFSFFVLVGLNGKGSLTDETVNSGFHAETDSSISQELLETIESYINETDSLFPESAPAIYSVYFFEKDGKTYISIWGNYVLPYYIETHNFSKKFDYTLFTIAERNVILIKAEDGEKHKLYNIGANKTGKSIVNKISNRYKNITYDGPSFPKTYEYHIEKGNYIITSINAMYFDFLGDDFLKYGKLPKD